MVGLFPVADIDNKYILAIMDNFSMLEAFTIQNQEARSSFFIVVFIDNKSPGHP